MPHSTILAATFVAAIGASLACSTGSQPTPPPAKPTTPAPAPSAAPPAASGTKPAPPPNAQKKELPREKRVAPPADWETMYDPVRGYSFEVPKGTTEDHNEGKDGVDVYIGTTPKPSELTILVVAFKDKRLTINDLFKTSEDILKELGFLLSHGKEEMLSDDYGLALGNLTDKDGKKYKVKILVATDVTDNYIMVVGTTEDEFKAHEQEIDQIWGSFTMYSGGASGNS
ncbi:hypothetical protein [Chloracidobacterium aggregatum]|uniref:Uncharacterized protein n=1 Tax=Chloracidobacterium sp. N TaxID=2821540 RepID=A0ABX8B1W6_9BACT|nr:hypothetical protein [Chloracidobacterium aggregatum]QUV84062.1 hypothetical protein J8C03_07890 [Chloracidobacterium sp. 2]QUV87452.1 hypothetical protein J8C07_09755 [Chloracidobacterium sp. S]QUV90354.1 hypothetical protein J8C04_08755 [Chloracidobacterium sp. A]QUV93566.1 hypothetical protein J8C05_09330 [Chloracidobacterium sp. N]QUV96722.1 hypothetical protein J8C00_10475 [Chloracidobacterium sp. E]